jgi:hypothetical protein
MAYEQRDDTGSLFKNEKKTQPSHADYNGSIKVGGVEYWLNAWIKESSGGKKFMSLSVKPKDARKPAQRPRADLDDNDPIPF